MTVSAVLSAALDGAMSPVRAQPFGWFFEAPPPNYGARRRRSGKAAQAPQQAEIPLPPPRPHFPSDPRPPEAVAAPPPSEPATGQTAPSTPAEPSHAAGPMPAAKLEKPAEPAKPSETAASPGTAPLPPPKPADLSKAAPGPNPPPGSAAKPGVAASGARLGEAPGQPVDDATCPGRLKDRQVAAEPVSIGPQPDPRCTVVEAVRLTQLTLPDGSKVEFPDHPTIACTTADTFSSFVRELLSPLAKGTYGTPVTAVWTGPGLECRSRDHIFGAKLSAHGQGLAIDIAQIKLGDGRLIEVGRPDNATDTGFQTAARAAACGYFHTALGPGSDEYHRTHWHFDLEVRGAHGDSKYCK